MNNTQLPPRILGISGQKGHGKNLLAAYIATADDAFRVTAFADPLKAMTALLFDLREGALHDPDLKEMPFAGPIRMDEYLQGMADLTRLAVEPRGLVARNVRELLQYFGTEYVRAAEPDFWVNLTMSAIRAQGQDAVIADVRFPNEADAIRRTGGLVIQVCRDHTRSTATHISEEMSFEPDALFNIRSGNLDRMRDCAMAAIVMIDSPREFPRRCRMAQPMIFGAEAVHGRHPAEVTE